MQRPQALLLHIMVLLGRLTVLAIFFVDMFIRPFARIYQKMPMVTFAILCVLYGLVAYAIWRSLSKEEQYY